jgi:hypothetical protein
VHIQKTTMLALLITTAHPNFSVAQTPNEPQLQAFTKTDFYKGLLNKILAKAPDAVFSRCPTLVSNGSQITVVKPISFAASGYPNAGVWKQTFPISGCGNDTILNIYFVAKADEKIDTVAALPGTTAADLKQQADAVVYAVTGARFAVRDCESSKFVVKNTKFEGFGLSKPPLPDPGPGQRKRPWWETWTLTGCGRTVDVPIDFVPDQTGTQIILPRGEVER